MPSFTNVFTGATIFPSTVSYSAYTLSANVSLAWPLDINTSDNVVASIMGVTAGAGPFSMTMPSATQVSVGQSVIFQNLGANTFSVLGNGGATVLTVASGTAWMMYLSNNSTDAGVWQTFQLGAGTSSATAASLAGYGLKAITTTLNQSMPVTSRSVNFTPDSTYRASAQVWTGGAGAVSLTNPATLGNDWFFDLRNQGSGDLTVTPLAGLIDGETAITFTPGQSATIVTDGTDFFTIGLEVAQASEYDTVSISVAGTGNYTLTGTELNRISYEFTGILTGDRTIIVPATVQQYWIVNNTTGAFNFYVKTAGQPGTGVRVSSGLSNIVFCNGTIVIDATTVRVLPELPTSSGTDTITLTVPTAPTRYLGGFFVQFIAGGTNTGAATLNVNSLGAVAVRINGVALSANAIVLGQVVTAFYNPTIPSFEMAETLMFGDGAVGTPTITFNGDRDTGFYRVSSNSFAGAVNGTQIILFNSNGSINNPTNPCFLATQTNGAGIANQTGNSANVTVQFDTEVYDVGGIFGSNTLTANTTGKWFLHASVDGFNFGAGANTGEIQIVASNRTAVLRKNPIPTTNVEDILTLATIMDMDAADTCTVSFRVAGMAGNTVGYYGAASTALLTYFSGALIN